MVNLFKEPLLHFVILGAAIFAAFNILGERDYEATDTLNVSQGKIENLATLFERTWQRPPSEQELEGLIQDFVREEILYREGLAMGLDQDDTVIRRRIRQKMDFIVEDMTVQAEPSDDVLQRYMQENIERFQIPPQISFQQIYLSQERRGDSTMEDAERLLTELQEGKVGQDALNSAMLGDSIMLEPEYKLLTPQGAARFFGQQFADQLVQLPVGEWQGPVVSGYGVHLLKLTERIEGRTPELADVRDSVLREWDNARRAESKEAFYQGLRERYNIVIGSGKPASDAGQ